MIKIYTDGSALPEDSRKLGSWSYLILEHENFIAAGSGTKANTSATEMELTAALEALKVITKRKKKRKFSINCDSQYVISGACANNQTTRDKILYSIWGDNHTYRELWLELWSMVEKENIVWQWVRGHNGDYGNEVVDKLARIALNYFLDHWNTGGTSLLGIWLQDDLKFRAKELLDREKSRIEGSAKKKGFGIRKVGDMLADRHQPNKKYVVVFEKLQWGKDWGVGCVILGQKNSLEIVGFENHRVDSMLKIKTSRKEDIIISDILSHFSASYQFSADEVKKQK